MHLKLQQNKTSETILLMKCANFYLPGIFCQIGEKYRTKIAVQIVKKIWHAIRMAWHTIIFRQFGRTDSEISLISNPCKKTKKIIKIVIFYFIF